MVSLVQNSNTIPLAVRAEICRRAQQLEQSASVAATILSTMRAAEIPFDQVSLEEMKEVLILALRAFAQRSAGSKRDAAA